RDQRVISTSTSTITVRKTGIEKWLYDLAHEQAFLYGLLSLAVALLAGWTASEVFRRIRG
ncbi:MAG: TIGR02186 family protein, partial [Rhodobacteraceae bacterium]|nr:TIGR02186 family protein [Paracoccaceae bacterium]